VTGNEFRVDPTRIGCVAQLCARQAVLSNDGADGSPYQGAEVSDAITFHQRNVWSRNHYVGPWDFMVRDTGTVVDFDTWRAEPYRQDSESTLTS
jgi:hypothetical protein